MNLDHLLNKHINYECRELKFSHLRVFYIDVTAFNCNELLHPSYYQPGEEKIQKNKIKKNKNNKISVATSN